MDKYQFSSREFRIKVLMLMLDNTWMAIWGGDTLIKPEYFELEDEETIAQAILDYRSSYDRSPHDPEDLVELAGSSCRELILSLYDRVDLELHLVSDRVVQFAREQAAKLAILESIDDVQRGNLQQPIDRMKAALQVGEKVLSPGIDPVADIDKWLYNYWTDKVSTGWLHIDEILDGGLSPGELGVVMGPPNRGKSMALINIGFGAASVYGGGKNVIHFTHEMSEAQTAKRYAARLLFKFPNRNDDLQQYSNDMIEFARKLLPGKIRIIGGAMTPADIECHVERLLAEDFKPDLIIDDYPDLVVSPRKYKERRFELSATFEWFRRLGAKYEMPIWVATQGNRGSLSKEIIGIQDIAEDIGKAAIADVIVALCQTYDEEQTDRCRLFMAKVRDGAKKTLVAAKFYGQAQSIVTTGIIKAKEGRDV